jgi:hypothetical protein
VTDGSGQYQIIDLRPGTYTITFTLSGFTTVVRRDVEVTGGGVTTINAEMRVSGLQETITVSGASPVVDLQTSTSREQVLSNEFVRPLPASRGYGNYLAGVPGISGTGLGASATPSNNFFTSRGGRSSEGNIQIDGMNVGSSVGGGGVSGYQYDMSNASEVQVTIAGGLAEVDCGGPAFNMIPKTGGNTFGGSYFGSLSGSWAQGRHRPAPAHRRHHGDRQSAAAGPAVRRAGQQSGHADREDRPREGDPGQRRPRLVQPDEREYRDGGRIDLRSGVAGRALDAADLGAAAPVRAPQRAVRFLKKSGRRETCALPPCGEIVLALAWPRDTDGRR